ncbi:heavy metal-associated isoprenylated plant protein 7 [Juglans microcarpa x Juglans regia]|uniref:heavy metal-associated isoprenylated plant protein 7 n=1 Tax=Juglans microcarpa x Juglans regia TaxID=2249226 RepID=UPI001B7F00C2|nr:heavy metal-associated isoprenylated plant protein 7 [Juglans microcarpa x Juglans regia]
MGEEEKKPEEKKMEEKKKNEEEKQSEKPAEEKKEEKKAEKGKDGKEAKDQSETQAPQEIVLRVYMHCEGCARKVRRCLKGFEGVEEVIADCKTSKVVVKGEKADPLNVLQRVQRKSHRQVQLISPIPEPKAEEEKKPEEKEPPKPEEKKEVPQIITAVLKVHMHCEACAQEIKKRILRMKGVESVEPDLKSSEVRVKGVFDPAKLVEYVYKRTGKHAAIVKQEPEKEKEKAKDDDSKEEKKAEEDGGGGDDKGDKGGSEDQEENKEKKGGDEESNSKPDSGGGAAMEEEINKVVELQKNAYYYYPQRYAMEMYAYPPQIFSDENPNACSIV